MFYNAKNHRINIDDTYMDYISFGSGKRNMIMFPGLSDGMRTVTGLAAPMAITYRELAKDFTVYVFSRKNDIPENYSSRDMARDQKLAMDIAGIEQADILGVSQGGTIAQYLAIDYPEKVNKLILAVTYSKQNSTIENAIKNWIAFAEKDDYASLMTDTAERSYSEAYLKKYRKFYPILTKIGKPKSFKRFITMAKAVAEHDAYDELDKIKCPTLIIGGKQDKIVSPEASYEMAEKINGSKIFMYDEYGHAAYEEAKDFFSRASGFFKGENKI